MKVIIQLQYSLTDSRVFQDAHASCINSIKRLELPGTRDRGRPRKTWSACVKKWYDYMQPGWCQPVSQEFMENECEALPGVAYPGVRDNRSTLNTKTGYDDDDDDDEVSTNPSQPTKNLQQQKTLTQPNPTQPKPWMDPTHDQLWCEHHRQQQQQQQQHHTCIWLSSCSSVSITLRFIVDWTALLCRFTLTHSFIFACSFLRHARTQIETFSIRCNQIDQKIHFRRQQKFCANYS